ncbi:hypothetical protein BDAP_001090 [Binucleata daphniae]
MASKKKLDADFTDEDYNDVIAAFDNADDMNEINDLDDIFCATNSDTIKILHQPVNKSKNTIIFSENDNKIDLQDILIKYNFVSDDAKQAVFSLNTNSVFNFDDKEKKHRTKTKKPRVINIDKNTEAVISRLGKCRYDYEHGEIKQEVKQIKFDKNNVFENKKISTSGCKNKPKTYKPKKNSK